MKKIVLGLTILILSSTITSAQTTFTCAYKQYCSWNNGTEKYDNCIGTAESSAFEINKAETSIRQTIQSVTTSYPIKSKQRKKKGVNIYLVVNNDGDKYYYIMDSGNQEVRVLNKKDGKAVLWIYSQTDESVSSE